MDQTKVDATFNDLDLIIKEIYGVKYVFIESGDLAIHQKCREQDLDISDFPDAKFWCELSWGSGNDDKYDFAYNDFGTTLGEAIGNCLNAFRLAVRNHEFEQVNAAKDTGIYEDIVSVTGGKFK